jgi:hypothetical protein
LASLLKNIFGKRLAKGWQKIGKRLAKNWQKVGKKLAKGWQKIGKVCYFITQNL